MKIVKLVSFFCFLTAIMVSCHKNKLEDELTSVTTEELYTLFSFDTQKDVYENLLSLNSFNKEKKYYVNGKTIVFSNLTQEDIDASQGKFRLIVEGTVNKTPFRNVLEFKGFKIKMPEEGTGENEGETEEGNGEDNTINPDELKSIFIFDPNCTVTMVIAEMEQFKGEKHINGKQVFIHEIQVVQQDAQLGSFTLLVSGNVNGKTNFEQTLEFTGFTPEGNKPADKPSDFNMAERAAVHITQGKDIYDIDFDTFYRVQNQNGLAQQLKDYITISSSDTGGIPYVYNEEDMHNTSLIGISYKPANKVLCLKVEYKGHTSPELSIPFDHNKYYSTFVSVNHGETGKYYQSGVLHYIYEYGGGGYLFGQFITARKGFLAEYMSSQSQGTYINYSVKLLSADNHQELAIFDVAVNGFKAPENLGNELIITGGKYSDFISEKLKKGITMEKVEELIKNTFYQHINDLSFLINSTPLTYSPNNNSLHSDTDKSLYFNDVIIEYQSIEKDANGGITLNVILSSVNSIITDATIPIKRFLLSSDLNK